MGHFDNFVVLPVYYQQFAAEFGDFLLVVEVLLDEEACEAAEHALGDLLDGVEGRHEDEQGNWFLAGKVGGAASADGPPHDVDVLGRAVHAEQVVVEVEGVLLDGVGDEGGGERGVAAVGGVLDGVEGGGGFGDDGLEEVADVADIFGVAVEVDEALLGLAAGGVGELEVGNIPALLHLRIRYAGEAAVLPGHVAVSALLRIQLVLGAGSGEDDAVALAAHHVAEQAREAADHATHPYFVITYYTESWYYLLRRDY
jgi:hypothetical protein